MKKMMKLVLPVVILAVLFSPVSGCKKKVQQQPVEQPKGAVQAPAESSAAVKVTVPVEASPVKASPAIVTAPSSAPAAEQTICPVMGGAVDKDIYTEYQGKKVYFCCKQCKGDFEKSPEKYTGKLPQFAK